MMNEATLEEKLAFGLQDRLAKSLHVAGLNNLDMAEALEVSPNTISNYVNGNTQPRKLYLREWALKTGVPLEWLLTGEFPGAPETQKAAARQASGGIGQMYLVEPPAGLEPATCGLQDRTSNPAIDMFTWKAAS